jgi:ketosteroid isomerase-like protein
MKNTVTALMFIFCFILTAGIIHAEDWNKVKKDIEEINNKLEAGIVAGDINQMTAFYTDDAVSLPSFEPALRGISEIKKKSQENLKTGYKITSADFKTTDVIGSGDLAVEVGEWNMTMLMPGSVDPMNDTGKYVTVWQKQADNSWKIKVETWNTNSNPTMMSQGEETNPDEMK